MFLIHICGLSFIQSDLTQSYLSCALSRLMELLPILGPEDKPREKQWYIPHSHTHTWFISHHYLPLLWYSDIFFLFKPCRYALVPRGEAPGPSVGHTCTFMPSASGGKGQIVIVGGANPSGSFSHCSLINLGNVSLYGILPQHDPWARSATWIDSTSVLHHTEFKTRLPDE